MKVLACDFEADYSEDYGIGALGVYHYLHSEKYNPYLISLYNEEFSWVGHPKDVPWDKVPDVDAYLAHNSGFDRQVFDRCIELGIIPAERRPKKWFCTANLAVFVGAPRNLKDASRYLLGVEVDKGMRMYMKGKTWEQAIAEGKSEQLKTYALDDSINCYGIWKKYESQWPEVERETAELTYVQTRRGIAINTDMLDTCLPKVMGARDKSLRDIPWYGQVDEDGKEIKPLSANALKAWLKRQNLPVPSTTEAKSPEFIKWQEENKDVKAVKAMQLYRSSNALALKAETLRSQVRPDGRYGFNMLYFGATTGRWSSSYEDDKNDSGGVNIQNLPKEEMYGLNLRHSLVAGKGKKFVISDYSQIEPRCLAWLSDDQKFLAAIRAGVPLYEAHARASMGWTGGLLKKESPKLYALAKARVLALGYGAGWAKFIIMAYMYGAAECLLDPVTEKQKQSFLKYIDRTHQQEKIEGFKTDKDWTEAINAWLIVMDFRASNPCIKKIWERLEKDCWKCSGTNYNVELPSGRVLPYFNVQTKGGLTVSKVLGAIPIKVWGGFLTENVTQATARDVMRDALLRLEKAGINTLFTVHDEIVCEVDKNFPKEEIRAIMNIEPEWMPGLPLEIEQDETDYYKK